MHHLRSDDGLRLAYQDQGKGHPIILVHGWMMSHHVWAPQIQEFSKTHRVIAPDLRGCGDSEARPGTHTMQRYADDLHNLIEHLSIHGATIVGWSMGGGITMEYLHRHGIAGARAIGLVDFPPRLEEDPSVADKVCSSLLNRRDAFLDSFVRRMILDPTRADLHDLLRSNANRCTPESACEMYRAMRPTAPAEPAPASTLPAFLAFPSQGWFPNALAQWRQRFPDHVAPEFSHSKHCPFIEEPGPFNRALHDFLKTD